MSSGTHVIFVKKRLRHGEACAKCRDIEARLNKDGLMRHVDQVVTALEDDPSSPGARLAERLGMRRAPFFVIRDAAGTEQVIESYLAFKRRCQDGGEPSAADLADTVDRHPDLAFI